MPQTSQTYTKKLLVALGISRLIWGPARVRYPLPATLKEGRSDARVSISPRHKAGLVRCHPLKQSPCLQPRLRPPHATPRPRLRNHSSPDRRGAAVPHRDTRRGTREQSWEPQSQRSPHGADIWGTHTCGGGEGVHALNACCVHSVSHLLSLLFRTTPKDKQYYFKVLRTLEQN